jgi:hypothetical protein
VDITVSTRGGPPSYPHRKVALASDRAEVAEVLESEGAGDVEYHGLLESRLRARHPDLAADTKWTAGWLAQSGDEAILWLHVSAAGVSAGDAEHVRRALSDWCAAAGVRKLEVTDFSRRNRSADSAAGDSSLP